MWLESPGPLGIMSQATTVQKSVARLPMTSTVPLKTVPVSLPTRLARSPAVNPEPAGNRTGRTVTCVKFQKELPGLDAPPWPGEVGQRIYDTVSAEAWKLWEDRQKMILNEYRLMPWQKEAQELIRKQMEDFFFGEEAALPPGYVPQQSK